MEKVITHPRGAIYFVDINFKEDAQGVQSGNRPCVVVSSDAGNSSSDVVTVLLITSKEKSSKGINVPFMNWNGEENVVLCNQIHTVSKKWLTNKCFGMMPSSVMKEIDKQLAVAMSISRNTVDISELTQAVNKIIDLKRQEIKNNKQPITQKAVTEIAEQLEHLFLDVLVPMDKEAKENEKEDIQKAAPILTSFIDAKTPLEKTEENKETDKSKVSEKHEIPEISEKKESLADTMVVEPEKSTKPKRKPKGFWTEEKIKEFINDKETMPLTALKQKWEIDNSQTIYQMYYRFKKDLGLNNEAK